MHISGQPAVPDIIQWVILAQALNKPECESGHPQLNHYYAVSII